MTTHRRLTDGEIIAMSKHPKIEDMSLLIAEVETLGDMLTDCWIMLDALARAKCVVPQIREAAAKLLHRHQAPGWKKSADLPSK